MKIPKEYQNNLSNGIISKDMMFESLYSIRARIHNCKVKEKKFMKLKNQAGIFHPEGQYHINRDKFNDQQNAFLKEFVSNGWLEEYCEFERMREYDGLSSLLSAQSVTKVLDIIRSREFQYVA